MCRLRDDAARGEERDAPGARPDLEGPPAHPRPPAPGHHLRGYGQRDPLNEYKRKRQAVRGHVALREDVVSVLAHVEFRAPRRPTGDRAEPVHAARSRLRAHDRSRPEPALVEAGDATSRAMAPRPRGGRARARRRQPQSIERSRPGARSRATPRARAAPARSTSTATGGCSDRAACRGRACSAAQPATMRHERASPAGRASSAPTSAARSAIDSRAAAPDSRGGSPRQGSHADGDITGLVMRRGRAACAAWRRRPAGTGATASAQRRACSAPGAASHLGRRSRSATRDRVHRREQRRRRGASGHGRYRTDRVTASR